MIICLYNLSIRRNFDLYNIAQKIEGLLCECVTDTYFSYKKWTLKSIEVKLINVEQLCSMYLCTKFGSSTLSCSKEIGIESCQNVSALPPDKPYNRRGKGSHLKLKWLHRVSHFNPAEIVLKDFFIFLLFVSKQHSPQLVENTGYHCIPFSETYTASFWTH
jgi:hypothetical protein